MTPFERAVLAVVDGDAATLRALLAADPSLVHARSPEPHHATLLHYVGANGFEPQRSPPNAPEIARILLEAGADPDATCQAYGPADTTLYLAVTSVHPLVAGVDRGIVDALADFGAALDLALGAAILHGFRPSAEQLVLRGACVDNLVYAAGIGRTNEVRAYLASGDHGPIARRDDDREGRYSYPLARGADLREAALIVAAMHGRVHCVRALLDAGVPVDATPWCRQTALHFAADMGRGEVVDELLARGARTDIVDTDAHGTAGDWGRASGALDAARLARL